MYINKLIKKQVMLILATVVLVGTLAVTTSFAVFEETKSNATDQKMTIGNLDVTYTGGSAISITDINPMTDGTALSKTDNIYTFTIENTGTVPYNFKVKVSPISLILLSKLSGVKLFLKVSLKVFVISLIIGIIFMSKNLLSIFYSQLNYKAIFRFLLFLFIYKSIFCKSPDFGNTINTY